MCFPRAAIARTGPAFALALMLSACGIRQQTVSFIGSHTACQRDAYSTPVWSPDPGGTGSGTQIDFTVGDAQGNSIHAMTRLGGSEHRLVSDAYLPQPSPDGRWLLYMTSFVTGRTAPPDYRLLDLQSMEDHDLGDLGILPAWSPDGQWIAVSPVLVREINRLDVPGGHLTRLVAVQPGRTAYIPLWSPDGKHIAFASDRDGGQVLLYLMNPDGTGITRLTSGAICPLTGDASADLPMAWRPDGGALLYGMSCGSGSILRMVTVDGREVTGLSYLNREVVSARWSPDGKQVMLYLDALGKPTIALADADGANSGLRVLRTDASDPSWSPDGKEIVFVGTNSAGLQDIYTIRPDGSGLAQLTSNPGAGRICLH